MTGEREDIAAEARRLVAEYNRREREIPSDYYSLLEPGVLFAKQGRDRVLLRMLRTEKVGPLERLHILDVGCGSGDWLADFESWGARRCNLAGLELNPERAEAAAARMGEKRDESGKILVAGADIRNGDASSLPWADGKFDIVLLSTVFSSILHPVMQQAVAGECRRVLRAGGWIVWYDFFFDNPRNPAVRGIRRAQIEVLFPEFEMELRRVTLAPPIARRVASVAWPLAFILQAAKLLNTHYLGILRKA